MRAEFVRQQQHLGPLRKKLSPEQEEVVLDLVRGTPGMQLEHGRDACFGGVQAENNDANSLQYLEAMKCDSEMGQKGQHKVSARKKATRFCKTFATATARCSPRSTKAPSCLT